MTMLLKGQITITRNSNDEIGIEIRDVDSGMDFCRLSMTPHEFARAITGLGSRPCDLDIRGVSRLGKTREHKTEIIPVSAYSIKDDEIDSLFATYQVDGWIGRRDDFKNGHRHSGDSGKHFYKVAFERWVDTINTPATPKEHE